MTQITKCVSEGQTDRQTDTHTHTHTLVTLTCLKVSHTSPYSLDPVLCTEAAYESVLFCILYVDQSSTTIIKTTAGTASNGLCHWSLKYLVAMLIMSNPASWADWNKKDAKLDKYGCRCKASIVKRRGQVIYELVREPDV